MRPRPATSGPARDEWAGRGEGGCCRADTSEPRARPRYRCEKGVRLEYVNGRWYPLLMAKPVRIEYPGAVCHVLTRGNNRQAVFKDDSDRTAYLERLFRYCQVKEVHLLCYCLLSNHVHLLLETPQGNLSRMMQAFQTSYTVSWNRRRRYTGHVFEQRYKAFLVDKDNYLLQVSRYIHLNPVAAHIVERPQDYRWSSYRGYLWEGGMTGVWREPVLGYFGDQLQVKIQRYREFVEGALQAGERWFELPVTQQS